MSIWILVKYVFGRLRLLIAAYRIYRLKITRLAYPSEEILRLFKVYKVYISTPAMISRFPNSCFLLNFSLSRKYDSSITNT